MSLLQSIKSPSLFLSAMSALVYYLNDGEFHVFIRTCQSLRKERAHALCRHTRHISSELSEMKQDVRQKVTKLCYDQKKSFDHTLWPNTKEIFFRELYPLPLPGLTDPPFLGMYQPQDELRKNINLTHITFAFQSLHLQDWKILMTLIKMNSSLSTLVLNSSLKTRHLSSSQELVQSLEQNTCISSLDFANNGVNNQDMELWSNFIKFNSTLTYLNLSSSHISTSGICLFMESLSFNRTLLTLRLHDCRLDDEDHEKAIQAFVRFISLDGSLTHLDLSECSFFSKSQVGTILDALGMNKTLQVLNLSDSNFYTAVSLPLKCPRLSLNDCLTQLDLRGLFLMDEDVTDLANFVRASKHLACLNISGSCINIPSLKHLCLALETSSSLQTIDLSQNQFNATHMIYIGNALRHNHSITYLDLSVNRMGDIGFDSLCQSLSFNRTLHYLNVSSNHITSFTDSIQNWCVSLKRIDVRQNPFGNTGIQKINEMIFSCRLNPSYTIPFHIYVWNFGQDSPNVQSPLDSVLDFHSRFCNFSFSSFIPMCSSHR